MFDTPNLPGNVLASRRRVSVMFLSYPFFRYIHSYMLAFRPVMGVTQPPVQGETPGLSFLRLSCSKPLDICHQKHECSKH